MPTVSLSYQSRSRPEFNGGVSFHVDDDEWNGMDTQEREAFLARKHDEWLRQDIQSTGAWVDGEPFDE